MSFPRPAWMSALQSAFATRNLVWLQGVRRVGKTLLAAQLPEATVLDCELPSHRAAVADPEAFLRSMAGTTVVLDEVHRLENPSEILKIAADHHPTVRVLATGSSTLGASPLFRDTLVGRKRDVWLTPMLAADVAAAGDFGWDRRMLHGGLPGFFLASSPDPRDYADWLDGYWSKDIQALFRLERRSAFLQFAELLMTNSGGIFDATRYATACRVSRTTISNYLGILEATFLVQVIRPFASRRQAEIVAAPKVFSFDSGFVCWARGIGQLRQDDRGNLWEHLVLNEIQGVLQHRDVHYWRDKAGHEIDFVLPARDGAAIAIECKWRGGEADLGNLRIFRRAYPNGRNFLVASDADPPFTRQVDDAVVEFVSLPRLRQALAASEPSPLAAENMTG